jgi:hypothetical protein
MTTAQQTTKQQILGTLDALREDQLEEVLDFIQRVQKRPRGIPGKELADFFRNQPNPPTEEEGRQMDAILKEMREMSRPHES